MKTIVRNNQAPIEVLEDKSLFIAIITRVFLDHKIIMTCTNIIENLTNDLGKLRTFTTL